MCWRKGRYYLSSFLVSLYSKIVCKINVWNKDKKLQNLSNTAYDLVDFIYSAANITSLAAYEIQIDTRTMQQEVANFAFYIFTLVIILSKPALYDVWTQQGKWSHQMMSMI